MLHCPYNKHGPALDSDATAKKLVLIIPTAPQPSHQKSKQAFIINTSFFSLYTASEQLNRLCLVIYIQNSIGKPSKRNFKRKWNAKQFKIPRICVTSNL